MTNAIPCDACGAFAYEPCEPADVCDVRVEEWSRFQVNPHDDPGVFRLPVSHDWL